MGQDKDKVRRIFGRSPRLRPAALREDSGQQVLDHDLDAAKCLKYASVRFRKFEEFPKSWHDQRLLVSRASHGAVTSAACRGRKLIAVNEVESNPSGWCNLPDGTFDSMLRDFTSHR